jgi:hypothetical protein
MVFPCAGMGWMPRGEISQNSTRLFHQAQTLTDPRPRDANGMAMNDLSISVWSASYQRFTFYLRI